MRIKDPFYNINEHFFKGRIRLKQLALKKWDMLASSRFFSSWGGLHHGFSVKRGNWIRFLFKQQQPAASAEWNWTTSKEQRTLFKYAVCLCVSVAAALTGWSSAIHSFCFDPACEGSNQLVLELCLAITLIAWDRISENTVVVTSTTISASLGDFLAWF